MRSTKIVKSKISR